MVGGKVAFGPQRLRRSGIGPPKRTFLRILPVQVRRLGLLIHTVAHKTSSLDFQPVSLGEAAPTESLWKRNASKSSKTT